MLKSRSRSKKGKYLIFYQYLLKYLTYQKIYKALNVYLRFFEGGVSGSQILFNVQTKEICEKKVFLEILAYILTFNEKCYLPKTAGPKYFFHIWTSWAP